MYHGCLVKNVSHGIHTHLVLHGRHINMWMKLIHENCIKAWQKNFDDFKYRAIYGELATIGIQFHRLHEMLMQELYIMIVFDMEETCMLQVVNGTIWTLFESSCINFRRSQMSPTTWGPPQTFYWCLAYFVMVWNHLYSTSFIAQTLELCNFVIQ